MSWFLTALVLAGTLFASIASATEVDSTASSHLLVTEAGFASVIQGYRPGLASTYTDIDLGYLRRVGRQTLVGAEVSYTLHYQGAFIALRPRVRQEIDRNWAANLAAGPIIAGLADERHLNGLGLSVTAGLDYRNVGVRFAVQSTKYSHFDPARLIPLNAFDLPVTTTALGVRCSGHPGAAAMAALVVAGLLIGAVYQGPFG